MPSRLLSTVENLLAAIPFAVVAVVAFVNVLSRYFLNASLAFTGEVTVNLAVWMVMMGAVIGLREGAHLGFGALHERATGALRTAMTVFITVAILAFLAILLYFGLDMALQQADRGRGTPSMEIPQWLFTIALPVGAVLGGYRAVEAAVRGITAQRSPGQRGPGQGDNRQGDNGASLATATTPEPDAEVER